MILHNQQKLHVTIWSVDMTIIWHTTKSRAITIHTYTIILVTVTLSSKSTCSNSLQLGFLWSVVTSLLRCLLACFSNRTLVLHGFNRSKWTTSRCRLHCFFWIRYVTSGIHFNTRNGPFQGWCFRDWPRGLLWNATRPSHCARMALHGPSYCRASVVSQFSFLCGCAPCHMLSQVMILTWLHTHWLRFHRVYWCHT